MFRSLCMPMSCKQRFDEPKEEYTPVTMTAIVLPVVVVIIIFIILSIFMYRKFVFWRELFVDLVLRKKTFVYFQNWTNVFSFRIVSFIENVC